MERIGFKMQLFPGKADEYKRRHDHLWPELEQLLRNSGIADYSIFLDEETSELFATMKIENPDMMGRLPEHPVMQKWWTFMKDIMESNPDHSPVTRSMKEVFHLS